MAGGAAPGPSQAVDECRSSPPASAVHPLMCTEPSGRHAGTVVVIDREMDSREAPRDGLPLTAQAGWIAALQTGRAIGQSDSATAYDDVEGA
jgi:hypothetical protein